MNSSILRRIEAIEQKLATFSGAKLRFADGTSIPLSSSKVERLVAAVCDGPETPEEQRLLDLLAQATDLEEPDGLLLTLSHAILNSPLPTDEERNNHEQK
jgi:hypothetical protein